jgi:hypothetical protein
MSSFIQLLHEEPLASPRNQVTLSEGDAVLTNTGWGSGDDVGRRFTQHLWVFMVLNPWLIIVLSING